MSGILRIVSIHGQIEQNILTLPKDQGEEMHNWLSELPDSQEDLAPEFVHVIECGKVGLKP